MREHRRARALADELGDARTKPAMLERRDDDTGLWNSRFFVEALTREIERARTYERPVALALASVDDIDADEVEQAMRTLGAAIGGSVRAIDVACRVGSTRVRRDHAGDRLAGRRRSRPSACCARSPAPVPRTARQPQAAVGIAACPAHAETFEELIERAGAALRSARRAVRDGAGASPARSPVAMAVWDDGRSD